MGMIIFIIASGLTLVFGLMDVLNFGHGVFIALGAFTATQRAGGRCRAGCRPTRALNLSALGLAMRWPWLVAGALGWAFERIVVARCTASTSSRSSSPWAA
jgi:branched-chain amino acid transport system permease protein